MAGARGNVAVAKQVALVHLGIVLRLARNVGEVARPAHEMRDGAYGTVAVERLQAEADERELSLHIGERGGSVAREQAERRLIAFDAAADEIAAAVVADLELESRYRLRRVDEPRMAALCLRNGSGQRDGQDGEKKAQLRLSVRPGGRRRGASPR